MRRALWETVTELAEALMPHGGAEALLRITDVSLDVPIDVRLRRVADNLELVADLPRWRWETGFEAPYGRLKIRFESGEPYE